MNHRGCFIAVVTAFWAVGITITATNFAHDDAWLYVGLTMCLVGAISVNTHVIDARSRSLREEFECGYRVGFREGRKDAPIRVIKGGQDGRVPEAPVRSLAGHRAAAGRASSHTH